MIIAVLSFLAGATVAFLIMAGVMLADLEDNDNE